MYEGLNLVNEQLVDLIQKHLHFHGGTDDKWWLQASVKTYLEHGKISGSFYQALEKIAEEYAFIQKHLYAIKLKTAEAKEAADAGEKELYKTMTRKRGEALEQLVNFPTRFKAKREDNDEYVEGSFIVRSGRNSYHYFILVLGDDLEDEDKEYRVDPTTLEPAEQFSDYLNMGG